MDNTELLKRIQEEFDKRDAKRPCPSCGHCPECGRRDALPVVPTYPPYQPGPVWIVPPYQFRPWWQNPVTTGGAIGSSAATGAGVSGTTVWFVNGNAT